MTPTELIEAAAKETDGDDFDDADDCPNCGGEGFVSSCFEEFACIDPESGCDLCTKRCDWCQPTRKSRALAPVKEG